MVSTLLVFHRKFSGSRAGQERFEDCMIFKRTWNDSPHYVRDYKRLVGQLSKKHSRKEAMSLAVGGGYEQTGITLRSIVAYFGLVDGMSVMDIGCGSGRLSTALGKEYKIEYLGLDVVKELLDVAKELAPKNYIFKLNQELSIPAKDNSYDMAYAFSLFTHLRHEETYIYMQDISRALKLDGRLIFSFLEFNGPGHWSVFQQTANELVKKRLPHLNVFIDREGIRMLAKHSGFEVVEFVTGDTAPWGDAPLGQSLVVLQKKSNPTTM